jgi:Zinc binding domain/BFD-like [2Fe-2S] binding domain
MGNDIACGEEKCVSDCCAVNAKIDAMPAILPCPVNDTRSKKVDTLTVKSLVRALPPGMPNTQYYFCDASDCDVVYFALDVEAPMFRREDLVVRVGTKETEDPIPVCYCFGFTRKDIENEIAETGRSTVADRIKTEVNAGNCACEVRNPSGKCCLWDVTRTAKDRQGGRESLSCDRTQRSLL